MNVRWKDGAAVPVLSNEDGTRATCIEPRLHLKHLCCGRTASYPDQRCALHTEWLSGTIEQRNQADGGPRSASSPRHRARAAAWAAWRDIQDPSLAIKGNAP